MKAMLITILVLSVYSIALTVFFFIKVKLLTKEKKVIKNKVKTVCNSIEELSYKLNSGNASHIRGNIKQAVGYMKTISE